MKVLWIHGKESGPYGSKWEALVDAGFDVIAPDLRGVELEGRVDRVMPVLVNERPFIVGSSLGGITAVLAARRLELRLPGIVLCAPALRYPSVTLSLEDLMVNAPVTIVHGTEDDITPIEYSRAWAAMHKARLVEVDDGHRLSLSTDVIINEVKKLYGTAQSLPVR